MRWVLIVVWFAFAVGCKKKQAEPEAAPAPSTPSVGHSSTQVSAEAETEHHAAEAPDDAGAVADAPLYGGNGKPAYRDEQGHVHGPGGPVYMGRGVECTDKVDHCLRPGVWFATAKVQPGKLYRATPAFELEGKWWSFREDEVTDYQALFKTKVVESASELQPGSPVVWLIDQNSSSKFLNSEHDALTSSRWEVGVIDSVSGNTFKVLGWPDPVPIDTARVITERK